MYAPNRRHVLPGILQAGSCSLLGANQRVLMLSHAAAITPSGSSSVEWLLASGHGTVTALMGPEHGFLGHASAGAACRTFRHPVWNLPVYSLYSKNRAPRTAWLRKCDVLLIDLQDLGYRPYTYVSTLYLALQAAAKCDLPVVVADRPIPLPNTVDGPMLDPAFTSFVGQIPLPFCYGMTPGETARWIQANLLPGLHLEVLPMEGFRRSCLGLQHDLPWIPPSPSIRHPETAVIYPFTVCLEGLPHIDHGRMTTTPFQLIGAAWIKPVELAHVLNQCEMPGLSVHPHVYVPQAGGTPVPGIRVTLQDIRIVRPAEGMVHILHALTSQYGRRRVWQHRAARTDFFDKLLGTNRVRLALMQGESPTSIVQGWNHEHYIRQRKEALLYQ